MTCKYIPSNVDSFKKTRRDFSDDTKMNVAKRKIVLSVLTNHFSSFLFFIQFVWKENLDTGCFLCIL